MILQKLQESTCVGVSFEFYEVFKNIIFTEQLRATACIV